MNISYNTMWRQERSHHSGHHRHTQNTCHFYQAIPQIWLSWGQILALFKVKGNDQVRTIKNSIVSAFVFRIIGAWNNEFQNQGCKFLENQNQTKNNGNKEEVHRTLQQATSPVLQFHSPGTLRFYIVIYLVKVKSFI